MAGPLDLDACIDAIYRDLEGWPAAEAYHQRHMTESLTILTMFNQERVRFAMALLRPAITGKRVVEIGAGVGLLALAMAKVADSVVAIEADPAWTWAFMKHLYRRKPANLTWVFGRAESVAQWIRADVAVVVTRSGHAAMQSVAAQMAPRVVDVYAGVDLEPVQEAKR